MERKLILFFSLLILEESTIKGNVWGLPVFFLFVAMVHILQVLCSAAVNVCL